MAFTVPTYLVGFDLSGDIGELTIYTDRHGRKVAYPKSPPKQPGTVLQLRVRKSFADAQKNYMDLSPLVKRDWETLVQRANLCMTGQNLFISISTRQNLDVLATLKQQTGVFVPDPPLV